MGPLAIGKGHSNGRGVSHKRGPGSSGLSGTESRGGQVTHLLMLNSKRPVSRTACRQKGGDGVCLSVHDAGRDFAGKGECSDRYC